MISADKKHSQPHNTFYLYVIFLSSGGRILHKFESLMMVLLSVYLASLSPTYSGGMIMLL